MAENQERRRARRQRRGLLRSAEILRAAGAVFAELGYDKATTTLIADRAGVSPGSLYQFFSNKEALALAYAAEAVAHLHLVYDTVLAPPVITLPFAAFNDTFIDALIAFNREYPGYLALSLASTISAPLARALAELQRGVLERLTMVFAVRWPESEPADRHLRVLVAYRIFLALLPLALDGDEDRRRAIVGELKTVLYRYLVAATSPPSLPGNPPAESPG